MGTIHYERRWKFNASSPTLEWIVDTYLPAFAGLLLTMGKLGRPCRRGGDIIASVRSPEPTRRLP